MAAFLSSSFDMIFLACTKEVGLDCLSESIEFAV